MPELKLVIGPAGSGKTWRVISAVAQAAAQGALPGPEHPPLLLIVPEQQAATLERAILVRLRDEHGLGASARIHVMSLTRLAVWLMDQAGGHDAQPGELGRRLLVWSLLPDGPHRDAQAGVYAEALAELAQYGVDADGLRLCAQQSPPAVAHKLSLLAAVHDSYAAACHERGLHFTPAVSRIPELLTAGNWPWLGATQVWVDGFAGFTPVEERALLALLERTAFVTATVLASPAAVHQGASHPLAREYRQTLELHRMWRALATQAGCPVSQLELDDAPRWHALPALAGLARHGLYGAGEGQAAAPPPPAGTSLPSLRALCCADERAEVEAAARTIRTLVQPPLLGGRGWRYKDITVITRSLEPYAMLVQLVFTGHGIPFFLDMRRSLAHHPAVEYVRCSLRMALGLAAQEDVYTLLKTGLLPGGPAAQGMVDELELYARQSALRPADWLREQPWSWRRKLLQREDSSPATMEAVARLEQRLQLYDNMRRFLLQPVQALRAALQPSRPGQLALRPALQAVWSTLVTPGVARTLALWADVQEAAADAAQATAHRGVLAAMAQLMDQLVLAAGEVALAPGALCSWLEAGLGALDMGFAPPVLDSVLVTDVERGRQHEVRGALLLGLSEDQWPPRARETQLLSDMDRRELNRAQRWLSGGAHERAGREPYLALVAATRPAELLHLSRPAGDSEGRVRQPAPYYTQLCSRLGLSETRGPGAALPQTGAELFTRAALEGSDPVLQQLAQQLADGAPQHAAALAWGQRQARSRCRLDNLALPALEAALGAAGNGGTLHASVSRLETFAACPFKHFARYMLRLEEPAQRGLTPAELGGFYHRVLERIISMFTGQPDGWAALRADEFVRAGLGVLDGLAAQLAEETGALRAEYVLQRARQVFSLKLPAELEALRAQQRTPQLAELRFGAQGCLLPPVIVDLEGAMLALSGYIDRLDLSPDGAATVVDYKLRAHSLAWGQFLAGRQLQLVAYLLAVDRQSIQLPQGVAELRAAAAEYSPLEPEWGRSNHGFTARSVPPVLAREADQAKLAGLLPGALAEARRIIRELGRRIVAGEITPLPLASTGAGATACSECGYRAVCRFDPLAGGVYRQPPAGPDTALRDAIALGQCFPGSASAAAVQEVGDAR